MAEPRPRRRSLLADTRPLRESPPFRRLWIGTTVSSLGSAMTSFALVLQTSASFGVALYSVARLPAMPPEEGDARPGFRAVAEGLRYIRRRPVLTAVFLADLDATVFGMPVALFPALNAARFGSSPQTLGLLNAGLAVGGLVGSTLSGPAGRVAGKARAMLFTVAIWGVAIAGFGFARVLWLALLMLVLAGAADTTTVIFRGSVVQTSTPDRFRGRVMAVEYVVGAGVPRLGNFEAGAVASLTSPAVSAVSGGLAAMAGAAMIRLAFPAVARYGARAGRAEAADDAVKDAITS